MRHGGLLFALILNIAAISQQAAIAQDFVPDQYPFGYVMVVGPGNDSSEANGHVLAGFSRQQDDLFDGVSYNFNLSQASPVDIPYWKRKFVLLRDDLWTVIQQYSSQNRTIRVFPLKLNPNQVSQLVTLLEAEKKRRDLRPQFDYGYLSNNCSTAVVNLINQVVAAGSKIKTKWDGSLPMFPVVLSRQGWVTNVPVSLGVVLRDHPLIDQSRINTIYPSSIGLYEIYKQINPKLSTLANHCAWSKSSVATLARLLVNNRVRYTRAFQQWVMHKLAGCRQPEVRPLRAEIVNYIIFDINHYSPLNDEQKKTLLSQWRELLVDE